MLSHSFTCLTQPVLRSATTPCFKRKYTKLNFQPFHCDFTKSAVKRRQFHKSENLGLYICFNIHSVHTSVHCIQTLIQYKLRGEITKHIPQEVCSKEMFFSHIFTQLKRPCNTLLTISNNLKICTFISENYSIYTCEHELT